MFQVLTATAKKRKMNEASGYEDGSLVGKYQFGLLCANILVCYRDCRVDAGHYHNYSARH